MNVQGAKINRAPQAPAPADLPAIGPLDQTACSVDVWDLGC